MNSGNLDAIVNLHKTYSEFVSAENRLNRIPDWMTELHGEHSRKLAEIEQAQQAGEEASRVRRQAEGELSDAQEKLKRYQEQLGQVSTQREYGALLKEIDTVKQQIKSLERQALEALEQAEQAEDAVRENQAGFEELDQRYKTELAKWEAEKPEIAKTVSRLKAEVDSWREKVSRPYLRLFERLYERTQGTALARIAKIEVLRGGNSLWHCSACSYNVRPQILVEIRSEGKLIQCESCKRILFWEEEEAAEG